jgi:hypothetical protein
MLRNLGDVLRAFSKVIQQLAIRIATLLNEGLFTDILYSFLLFISTKRHLHIDNDTQASPMPAGKNSSCSCVRSLSGLGELQALQPIVTVVACQTSTRSSSMAV